MTKEVRGDVLMGGSAIVAGVHVSPFTPIELKQLIQQPVLT